MAVRTEVSVVSAMAGRGSRSLLNLPTSSAAKCCASAALPPFPTSSTLLPFKRHLSRVRAAAPICSVDDFTRLRRKSAPSFSRRLISCSGASDDIGRPPHGACLLRQPRGCVDDGADRNTEDAVRGACAATPRAPLPRLLRSDDPVG